MIHDPRGPDQAAAPLSPAASTPPSDTTSSHRPGRASSSKSITRWASTAARQPTSSNGALSSIGVSNWSAGGLANSAAPATSAPPVITLLSERQS